MSDHSHTGPSGDQAHETDQQQARSFAQEAVHQTAGAQANTGATGFPNGSPGNAAPNFSNPTLGDGSAGGTPTTPNPTGGHGTNVQMSGSINHPTTAQTSGNVGGNTGGWNETTGGSGTTSTNSGNTGTNPTNTGTNWTEGNVSTNPTTNTPNTRSGSSSDNASTLNAFSGGTSTSGTTGSTTGGNTGVKLGKGLDIGTANLVTAVQNEQGGITIKMERNAFIDIDADVYSKRMLTKLQVPYVVHNDRMVVLGDSAFELSNIFSRDTRRPMKDGLISPSEVDALGIIRLIIDKILGAPRGEGEKVYFSVPAASIDRPNNVIYHQGLFEGLLRKMNYVPHPMNEAHAVVFSELAEQNFTGIGISCGGGMFNVCVAYKTIPALTFSICRGGDWIDQNVANVLGIPTSKATSVKERGVDLMNPRNREEEAVVIYYRNLINYTLINIKNKFEVAQDMPEFPEPIDIVFSGGTSMIGGFAELCDEELKKINFPIPVNRIRRAKDPLSSVARGCLIAAAIGE